MTVRDFREFVEMVGTHLEIHGATREFIIEYKEKRAEIGDALREEQGIANPDYVDFPRSTVFGEKAEKLFSDLKKWVHEKSQGLIS